MRLWMLNGRAAVAAALGIALGAGLSTANAGTIVRFETSMGDFEAVMYDTATPITVTNFVYYISNTLFNGTFIHRSVPGFVIQGGGYSYDGEFIYSVPTQPAIVNEFASSPADSMGRKNVRGTLSMARTASLNSATSQFFINLVDNTFLDNPASPYAVFGRVLDNPADPNDGMAVVDAIAALPVVNAGGAFSELPLQSFPPPGEFLRPQDLVTLFDVFVVTPGDTDRDKDVDFDDLGVLLGAYDTTVSPGTSGDGDADGDVDFDDLGALLGNYEAGAPAGAIEPAILPATFVVPEPGTLAIAPLAATMLLRRRRR